MNPNTIFNALESSARPRLHSWMQSGRDGQTFDARCTVRGKSISVKVHHGARAILWDGKPKYFNTMD